MIFAPALIRLAVFVLAHLMPLFVFVFAASVFTQSLRADQDDTVRAAMSSSPSYNSASTCAKGAGAQHVRKMKEAAAKGGFSHDNKETDTDARASNEKKQAGRVRHNLSSARFEETADGVRVLIGVPGVRAQDLEVRQDELTLSVSGQSERGDDIYIVDQHVELPSCIDMDSAQCTHTNGVLMIELKKKVGKTIPVSVGVEVDPPAKVSTEPASSTGSDNEFEFE